MGLPLFIAPVESDIPSKSPVKSPADPAHARSSIRRRFDRRRQGHEDREHRLRMLAALQPDNDILAAAGVPSDSPARALTSSVPRAARARYDDYNGSARDRQPRSDLERRDRISARRNAELLGRDTRPGTVVIDPRELGRLRASEQAELTRAHQQSQLARFREQTELRRQFLVDSSPDEVDSDGNQPAPEQPFQAARERAYETYSGLPRSHTQSRLSVNQIPPAPRRGTDWRRPESLLREPRVPYANYLDGLGDRDRSLSPDGVGAWDTLQSTLTPDPQPPSVRTSFASTNPSNAASQSGEATSLNTSITDTEPPCDPVMDNDGTDDEDTPRRPHGRSYSGRRDYSRPTPPYGLRSYADVAADLQSEMQSRQSPEPVSGPAAEAERWLSGMQRIITGLAASRDIPDEWWTDAGLSRSMSYDEEMTEDP